jgi:hypothetical protein
MKVMVLEEEEEEDKGGRLLGGRSVCSSRVLGGRLYARDQHAFITCVSKGIAQGRQRKKKKEKTADKREKGETVQRSALLLCCMGSPRAQNQD